MPTGDCYEVHFRFLLDQVEEEEMDSWTVCHGTVTNAEGKTIGHCWLEHGGNAYDFSNDRRTLTPVAKYREILQARDVVSYPAKQARINGIKHRHCGPWT